MSQKLEQLEGNYLKEKEQVERKIEDIRFAKNKGVQILEDIMESSKYYIKTITDDRTELYEGQRALNELGDDFQESCQCAVRKYDSELEDMERIYRRSYQKLSDQAEKVGGELCDD
ncbi:hypothetical protein I6N96_04220 [Enterococcus sp. BWM-S5]|uniref:DUF5082 domain-containing protein n=1 Tax=Enterococcus larvae TaxID=2794352 RepID=A0ABS4CGB1_9ENTE|nr:hypothetical protein [Enterococcus larvae]MBP1045470.1 hypothetical protein [Enterococcus larvae]